MFTAIASHCISFQCKDYRIGSSLKFAEERGFTCSEDEIEEITPFPSRGYHEVNSSEQAQAKVEGMRTEDEAPRHTRVPSAADQEKVIGQFVCKDMGS